MINLFHTISVSYTHRVLNSSRFSVLFAWVLARGPSDNMIGLLRSRRFATVRKALLLACYGQFKLTVASQSSRSFSQLASWLLQVTGSSCTERTQIISKYTFRIFNSAFQISITQTSFTLNWNSLTTPGPINYSVELKFNNVNRKTTFIENSWRWSEIQYGKCAVHVRDIKFSKIFEILSLVFSIQCAVCYLWLSCEDICY